MARSIGLAVRAAEVVPSARIVPALFFGRGTVARIASVIRGDGAGADGNGEAGGSELVIVNGTLTPVQQRNLENEWGCKVIDRTGLILEIFGARAQSREGRMQVELAALSYQRSRLVRSWTHLERQRGGYGFLGGPGETQIEADRRLISKRIGRLQRALRNVKRTRHLHRRARRRVPYTVIALVGYTNAGKSTLFNRLTSGGVSARSRLFETLDPTMRVMRFPSGRQAVLSDTVGFIADLPHELVEAFHATLEEVIESDLIVHVRDAAHPETEAQKQDVVRVLDELGLGDRMADSVVEVLNKIDLLEPETKEAVGRRIERSNAESYPTSALTGEGISKLVSGLHARLADEDALVNVSIPASDGASLAWLYDHGEIVDRRDLDDLVHLKVRLDAVNEARFAKRMQAGAG